MKQIGIYKITSPSKKIYIGQSSDIEYRWKTYKRLHCKNQTCLYNSFKKYGVNKHKFEIVQLCEFEQLNELEKYYMDLFQTFNNKYGMNLKDGGDAHSSMSEESKRKMSIAKKGIKLSIEHRQKIGEANKGNKRSKEAVLKTALGNTGKKRNDESKLKMSISATGHKHSNESKLKIGLALKNRIYSNETKEKLRLANCKLILNTETGIFYHGIKEAANAYSINSNTLKNKLGGFKKNNTNLIYV
jgi:group I intron endonuclease